MKILFRIMMPAILLAFLVQGGLKAQMFSDESLKFSQALNWIGKYYVDSVDKSELVETAIREMLETLDPHSTYLTREEVKAMSEPLQGNFEGIGISFNILEDTLFVINPVPGGPSEEVGIRPGDRIVLIGGENVAGVGIQNSDVYAKLKGPKGTQVKVSVYRRKAKNLLDFTITRDKIPIHSLDASYMIGAGTGYVKLNRFSFSTLEEFREACTQLEKEGMEDLILDLSGNGGGYMDVSVKLADEFLDDRKLIVYTEGISHEKRKYYATQKGSFKDGRLVVIIDQTSASASEILAGALQDWDRAVIVGRRSFGKGLVQNPMLLIDSSMIRLTIARYYTPTGRLIQKPYDNGMEEYSKELVNRYNNGELSTEDSIHFPDSLRYETLVSHRSVYGGGGIMPDYFVPIDTSFITDYYSKLDRKRIIPVFALTYIDDHRNELQERYPSFVDFRDEFEVTEELLHELTGYATGENIQYVPEQFEISRPGIQLRLKAYMGSYLYTSAAFYEIVNRENPSVLQALEVLGNRDVYQALLQENR